MTPDAVFLLLLLALGAESQSPLAPGVKRICIPDADGRHWVCGTSENPPVLERSASPEAPPVDPAAAGGGREGALHDLACVVEGPKVQLFIPIPDARLNSRIDHYFCDHLIAAHEQRQDLEFMDFELSGDGEELERTGFAGSSAQTWNIRRLGLIVRPLIPSHIFG